MKKTGCNTLPYESTLEVIFVSYKKNTRKDESRKDEPFYYTIVAA